MCDAWHSWRPPLRGARSRCLGPSAPGDGGALMVVVADVETMTGEVVVEWSAAGVLGIQM